MSLTAYERETVIIFNDEESYTTVYTCMRTMMTKLDKLVKSNPSTYSIIKEDEYSKTYRINSKKLISFRTPTTRKYTDEQREILSKRFLDSRTKQK